RIYDLKRGIGECKEEDVDMAMSYLPNFLLGLKTSAPAYYKFIDYDNHVFGTHDKLYSWVRSPRKRFECSSDPNEKILDEMKVSPSEVRWKERALKDSAEARKTIY